MKEGVGSTEEEEEKMPFLNPSEGAVRKMMCPQSVGGVK